MSAPISDVLRLLAALGLANLTRNQLYPPPYNVRALTTSTVINPSEPCGALFTNRGASGAITITLPAPTAVPQGTFYDIYPVVAQNVIIATAVADTFGVINDLAADTITISTASQIIGAHCRVICDGTQWLFVGDTVGITYTAAT